ncbi:MAG: hypothetical protein LQ340_008112, partial [Diploschistes diacapsis]
LLPQAAQVRRNATHLHARRALDIPQGLARALHQALQVAAVVHVGELVPHFAEGREQGAVAEVVAEGGVHGQAGVDVRGADGEGGLVGPQARDVARGVAAAADQQQGQAEGLGVAHARAVRLDVQVEAAQPVAAQRVGAALQHDGRRPEGRHRGADHVPEQPHVLLVLDPRVQRHVERVVRARVRVRLGPRVRQRARAGEEFLRVVLVKGERHDPVRRPEGLLDPVAVVHVDVDVQHARVRVQQLQDRQHDVVDVAEARRFVLFRVVQPARPVYCDLRLLRRQFARRVQRAARVERAVAVQPVEDGAVVAEVVLRRRLEEGGVRGVEGRYAGGLG